MANFVMTQGGEISIRDLLNEYFGSGGAAGGGTAVGTNSGTAGIGTIGAAIAATIIKDKTEKTHLENFKPEIEAKPIPEDIPSDLTQPGVQEIPYLPNVGVIGQEIPYLPNVGVIGQGKEDLLIQNPQAPSEIEPTPPIADIEDKTNENEEITISPTFDMQNMYDFILQQQQRQWEREDAIRAETQAREDNAWQRSVTDMRKAGVNPNLVNAGPAASGGGITNATGLDYSPWTAEVNKSLALLEQEIQNGFKGDENAKDRFTKGITNLLQLFALMAMKG